VGTFGAAAQLQKSPMRHMICLESAGQAVTGFPRLAPTAHFHIRIRVFWNCGAMTVSPQ